VLTKIVSKGVAIFMVNAPTILLKIFQEAHVFTTMTETTMKLFAKKNNVVKDAAL
jgi:hypothetical protein